MSRKKLRRGNDTDISLSAMKKKIIRLQEEKEAEIDASEIINDQNYRLKMDLEESKEHLNIKEKRVQDVEIKLA